MNGYKTTFDECAANAAALSAIQNICQIYPQFRNRPELFHFAMACGEIRYFSDPEAMTMALRINPILADFLVRLGPSKAGGGLPTIDVVESRHILMITYMCSLLEKYGESIDGKNVVEFGAGYGNFTRLMHNVTNPKNWTIVDLEFILQLQKWFLKEEHVDSRNITFINTKEYTAINDVWLTIGTHSLSELDIDTFKLYFDTTISKSKYLFYVCHNTRPDIHLLNQKMTLINTTFELVESQKYEGNQCTMYLFENTGM